MSNRKTAIKTTLTVSMALAMAVGMVPQIALEANENSDETIFTGALENSSLSEIVITEENKEVISSHKDDKPVGDKETVNELENDDNIDDGYQMLLEEEIKGQLWAYNEQKDNLSHEDLLLMESLLDLIDDNGLVFDETYSGYIERLRTDIDNIKNNTEKPDQNYSGENEETTVSDFVAEIQRRIESLSVGNLTLEDKQTVLSLQAEIDALSDELQGMLVLDKLEAALAEIEALENGADQDTEEEVPEENPVVTYKEASEGVEYEFNEISSEEEIQITITLTEEVEGDLVIDLGSKVLEWLDSFGQSAGDTYSISYKIINNSGKDYKYKDGSFVLSTDDNTKYGELSNILGFDGQRIPRMLLTYRHFSKNTINAMGVKGDTLKDCLTIGQQLIEQGYSEESPIYEYFKNHFEWEEGVLPPAQELNSVAKYKTFTEAEYQALSETMSNLDDFVEKKGSKYVVLETDPKLAQTEFEALYTYLFGFIFETSTTSNEDGDYESFNPNRGHEIAHKYGIANYVKDTNGVQSDVDKELSSKLSEGFKEVDLNSKMFIDGPCMGNAFTNVNLVFYNVFELEEVVSEYNVTINYYNMDGERIDDSFTGTLPAEKEYDLTDLTTGHKIDNYTFVRTEGSDIEGIATGNVTIDVYYDVEEDRPSRPDRPSKPDDDDKDDEVIEEEETPETGGDEEETIPEEVIEEETTPEVGNQDEVPNTGVKSTLPWLFAFVASCFVMALELLKRKAK